MHFEGDSLRYSIKIEYVKAANCLVISLKMINSYNI